MPRRLLSSLLLVSTLSLGACAPSMPHGTARPRPVVTTPKPALDRAAVRAALATRRALVFERFLDYREARVYPINTFTAEPEHIWLDSFGHLCAAATLISEDWGRAAAEQVAAENNFIRMADVHDGPLHDWVLTSGLTHHEIVAIQVLPVDPEPRRGERPPPDELPAQPPEEIARLYTLYTDVERQMTAMWDEDLDDATDALMARPDLARQLLDGVASGPGRYAVPVG